MKIFPRLLCGLLMIFSFEYLFIAETIFAQDKKIFILHSYHQEYPWTKAENNGFTQTLTSNFLSGNINFSTEYLDTKRIKFDKEYQEFFFHYLKQKYDNYSPDIIFCSDDNALNFFLHFREKLFDDALVVFCGVNNLDVQKDLDHKKYIGVFEKKEIIPNLALIKKIIPNPGKILFLGDNSSTYRAIEQKIRADISSQMPDQKYEFITSHNLSSLIKQLKSYKKGIIFLTTIGEIKDEYDNVVPLKKTLASIVNSGDFTTISMEDDYLEDGILGGYVTNGFSQGKEAANLALKIFRFIRKSRTSHK